MSSFVGTLDDPFSLLKDIPLTVRVRKTSLNVLEFEWSRKNNSVMSEMYEKNFSSKFSTMLCGIVLLTVCEVHSTNVLTLKFNSNLPRELSYLSFLLYKKKI